MTAEASRSFGKAAGGLLLIALAGLIVLLSALAVVVVLPVTLVLIVIALFAGSPIGGMWGWLFLLWLPAAFVAALYNVVAGLALTEQPTAGRVARLVGLSVLVFFTFPPFWFPGA